MEPPTKRQRLGRPAYDAAEDEDEDELGLEPGEFAAKQDPGYQLEKGRAMAANRLKSTFEHIFEKYERDFTGIGDEIDLRTGDIVVDNGHLHSMRDVHDAGDGQSQADGDGDGDGDDADTIEEEDRILLGTGSAALRPSTALLPPKTASPQPGAWPRLTSMTGGSPRLSSMFNSPPSFMGAAQMPMGPFGVGARTGFEAVDPTWMAPELPLSAYTSSFQSSFAHGTPRPHYTHTRTVARKTIQAVQYADTEDDDVLLGVGRTELLGTTLIATAQEGSEDMGSVEGTRPSASPVGPHDVAMADATAAVTSNEPPDTQAAETAADSRESAVVTAPSLVETSGKKGKGTKRHRAESSVKERGDGPAVAEPKQKQRRRQARPVVIEQQRTEEKRDDKPEESCPAPSKEATVLNTTPAGQPTSQVMVVKSRRKPGRPPGAKSQAPLSKARLAREERRAEIPRDGRAGSAKDAQERGFVVEIVVKKRTAQGRERASVAQVLQGEASKAGPTGPDVDAASDARPTRAPGTQIAVRDGPAGNAASESTAKPVETFSRNVVDPSYIFSDEENVPPDTAVDAGRPAQACKSGVVGKKEKTTAAPPPAQSRTGSGPPPTAVLSSPEPPASRPKRRRSSRLPGGPDAVPEKTKAGDSGPGPGPDDGQPRAEPPSPGVQQPTPPTELPPSSPLPRALAAGGSPPRRKKAARRPSAEAAAAKPGASPRTPRGAGSAQATPPSRRSIVSLVSDDEDDDDDGAGATPARPASTPRRRGGGGLRRGLLLSSHGKGAPGRSPPPRPPSPSAMRRRRSTGLGAAAAAAALPLPLPPAAALRRASGSPAGSPVTRTPGGTARRCGEDGFRCARDFCFTCM